MSDDDDVIRASGAAETAVTLTTLPSDKLAPLAYVLAEAVPDLTNGGSVPAFGHVFVDASGFFVKSQ